MADKFTFCGAAFNEIAGVGHREFANNRDDYNELNNQNINWRQVLDNSFLLNENHHAYIIHDGHTFMSVDHVIKYEKAKILNKKNPALYALTSLSVTSTHVIKKPSVLTGDLLIQWNNIKSNIIYRAQLCKFTNNADLKQLLINTKNAQLYYCPINKDPIRCLELERVRSEL
jgi:predicted NAD-dependent protein-ADP-ribosyltransferase YbiA (DUF1768 family)